jgi:hypothetical protein
VDDEFIDQPASQAGLVNGSWERINRIIGPSAFDMAMVAREVFHGGQTGSYGHSVAQQAGNLGGWNASGPYNNGQQARWVAEEAIRQFEARGDVLPSIMTQAYLWAGYANRVLGDGWCIGAIDGGPPITGKVYHEHAVAHFTKAIAIAPTDSLKYAALAGRAQARLWLEDWDGAIADARQVPNTYRWMLEMDFSKGGLTNDRNHIMWGNANAPYRSWTVRFTYYDTYFTQTGDPRTPWADFPAVADRLCVGSLNGFPGGRVPCTQQRKYVSDDDDIRLAGGPEMRLLEAEALLAKSDANWPQALQLINTLRTSYKSLAGARAALDPWTATNANETWRILKRERGIELWMEGRRYADLRRWTPQFGTGFTTSKWPRGVEQGPQGDLDMPDFASRMSTPANNLFTQNWRGRPALEGGEVFPRELCYNVSTTERDTNPHFQESDDEP